MNSARWYISVAQVTDQALIVEEAIRGNILELTAEQTKAANADISERDLASIVEEAIEWARK